MRCVVCGTYGCDPCHLKSKGAGGDDSWENLIPQCRRCHTIQHAKGHKFMWDNFYSYRSALESRGWVITENGKLRRK